MTILAVTKSGAGRALAQACHCQAMATKDGQ